MATVLVTAAATSFAAEAERKLGPQVNVGGVVNAAGFAAGPGDSVAPGSIVAIFGVDLALRTHAAGAGDLEGSSLPRLLSNVEVQINSISAPLYFVSPLQVNCQIPVLLRPRDAPYSMRVVHNNEASPPVPVRISSAAPGLFPVVAHQDFSIVGRGEGETPAVAGELIVLFGSGFGPTAFPLDSGRIATRASAITLPHRVLVDGVDLPPGRVPYVGLTPGYAGLYQANILLPVELDGPETVVGIEIDGVATPQGAVVATETGSRLQP